MTYTELLPDCYLINRQRHTDNRGFFEELYVKGQGPKFKPVQMNVSCSKEGVIRGIHCSKFAKLCTCLAGRLYDVVVDLRPESPMYRKWVGVWLSAEEPWQLLVPADCGHGFYSDRPDTILLYMQEGIYDPSSERSLNCFDPLVAIAWPPKENYILSEKDRMAPFLGQDVSLS